jgi:hypothetical protein
VCTEQCCSVARTPFHPPGVAFILFFGVGFERGDEFFYLNRRAKPIEFGAEFEEELVAFAALEPFGHVGKHGAVGLEHSRGPGDGLRGARLGEEAEHQRAWE